MKVIALAILLLTILSPALAGPLKVGDNWEEDIGVLVSLARATWEGYMAQFHYEKTYDLPEKCLGKEFAHDVAELVNITIDREDDYIIKIIKAVEKLGHMYDLTEQSCDIYKLFSEIESQCSKVGCDIVRLIFRGEMHMGKLLELYADISRHFNENYHDVKEAIEGFHHIGYDWAEGFHLVLDMKLSS